MVTAPPAPPPVTLPAMLITGVLLLASAPELVGRAATASATAASGIRAPGTADGGGEEGTGVEGSTAMVCVIAPRVEAGAGDPLGRGRVMERPTLVVSDPLREVIVERPGKASLRLRSPAGVLPPVIPWQGDALRPGERVTLRLRPAASPPGQGAGLTLVAASAEVLAGYRLEKRRLGRHPQAWLEAIEGHLDRGDSARAWALLFDPQAPAATALEQLRREVFRQGCGESAVTEPQR